MTTRDGELRAADGVRIRWRAWEADGPRAVLLVSHGLGEHGGRYAALAEDLVPRGITVVAPDHRGHGRSEGNRGHVERFADYVRDLEDVRRAVAAATEGLPMFLLGHSMGGLIAIRHLQAHPEAPFAGAILSAPLLGVAVRAPRWKVALSGLLSRWLPRLPFANEVDPAVLSSAEGYADAYRADPLVHDRITPRLYTEFLREIEEAFRLCADVRVPLLLLAPQDDRVVLPAAVERWARAHPGAPEVRRYDGFRHESLNEADRHRVVDDVLAWMEGRIG